MRIVLAVLVLALGGAAAWWFTGGGGSGPEGADGPTADGDLAEAPDTVEGALLAHKGRSPLDAKVATGRSAIVGTVRRGALPVAATVEARKIQDVGSVSTFGRYGARFFDRLLLRPNATVDVAATARAGDDGRFAIEGLSPGVYEVAAIATDGTRGWATTTLPVEGARVEANPVVAGGNETLKGRVVHADGHAWQGQVLLEAPAAANTGFDPGGLRGAILSLDAEGRFTADGLASGPVSLTAIAAESFRAISRPVTLPYAGEYVFVVDAGLATLKGRVVADADGSPVPGAVVMAGGRGGESSVVAMRTQTDADGRFEAQVTLVEGWGVGITADGFAPVFLQRQEAQGKDPMEVRLVKAATLKGRVTRAADGAPAPGLSVRVVPIGDVQTYVGGGLGTTDADGRYEITSLVSGEAAAFAEGPGWITQGIRLFDDRGYNPLALTLTAGETTIADLVVVPGARAEGVALDSAGAPVAGALVTPQPAGGAPRAMRQFGYSTTPTATGSDGRFVLDALTPGIAYTFSGQAAGYARVTAGPLVPTEGVAITVEIRFVAPRFLDVTVLDDGSGAPIPGARVSVFAVQAFTGTDGKTRVGPLPVEQGGLRIDADGYVTAGMRGELLTIEGETSRVVRMVKGLDLSGRVLDADRAPVSSATVELQVLGQNTDFWVQPVATGADGSFRFRGLPALRYTVRARSRADARGLTGSTTASSGTTDLVITLNVPTEADTLGTLLIRAVDPAGKPVMRASVRCSNGHSSSTTSISEGVARVQMGTTRGAASVEVWGARGVDGSLLPLGPAKVSVAADVPEIVVPLPPEIRIEGFVRGPEGKPVAGAVVAAVQKDRAQEYVWSRSGVSRSRTDASGAFHLGGLAAQDYLLQVQVPPEFVAPEPLPVAGDARNVEIRLEVGLVVSITVLDADGKPVAGATVRADADDRGLPEGMAGRMFPRTDASGVALLTGLARDRAYRLQVHSERPDVFPEDRPQWHPRDETIRLGRAYAVKGIVRDTQGRPVPNAFVYRQMGENNWNSTNAGPDGTFTIPLVPAGSVILRPGFDGMEANAPEVTVAAGATNVVLTLDVGLELVVRIDNWPTVAPSWLQAQLAIRRGDQRNVRSPPPAAGGVLTFRGLTADDVCALFVPPVGDGLSLLLRDLKPGREIRAHLEPGKTITGRLRLPAGATNVNVNASLDDFAYLNATMETEGRFTFRGAVDGVWKIQASASTAGGAVRHSASGEVPAGGSIDLELKAQTR